MQYSRIVFFALLICASAFSNTKIVGGERVQDISEAPFIVKFKGGCAGSIIHKKWILTAAHCDRIFKAGISAGSLDANSNKLRLRVARVFVHPEYNEWTYSNDMALIKLRQDIPLNGNSVDSIDLADFDHVAYGFQLPGEIATVFGWGATREDGNLVRYLRKVEVPIVSNEVANQSGSYDGEVDESMIAAGLPEGGKDSCQGDSGGPMVTLGAQGKQVLTGVVSWGIGCARRLKYGVYSKVSKNYEWIKNTISRN